MNVVDSADNAVAANARGLANMSVRNTTKLAREMRERTISNNKLSDASLG